MQDRLLASRGLLRPTRGLLRPNGVLAAAIDDIQQRELSFLLSDVFEDNLLGTVTVRANPPGRPTKAGFSVSHEYVNFAGNSSKSVIWRMPPSPEQMARFSQKDEDGPFEWRNLRCEGSNSDRDARQFLYYPIYIHQGKIRVPKLEWDAENEEWIPQDTPDVGEQVVFPDDEDGNLKTWRWGHEKVLKSLSQLAVRKDRSGRDYIYYKRRPHEDGVACVTTWADAKYSATEHGTALLKNLFKQSPFSYPKSLYAVMDSIYVAGGFVRDAAVLDYFGGSGTTAHAVIKLNQSDRGQRRYVIVEMGPHFDQVLLPRIKKTIYSHNWSEGKPVSHDGLSHSIKYVRLESYEDCLNNLVLDTGAAEPAIKAIPELARDYLLYYCLDVETKGSQSLLNIAQFRDLMAYKLEVKRPGADERVLKNIDLVETFNWLIGLHVEKLHAGRRYAASFVRKPDPLLPEDAQTRLQIAMLMEAEDAPWWFCPVEGWVRTVPGDDTQRQSVLVLWRTLTDDPEQDAVVEAFLREQLCFDPNRREGKAPYDVIYINGSHNLPNVGKYGEVRLLEEEFHRRMWAQDEV